jgi:SAM-dependent methyltransferase
MFTEADAYERFMGRWSRLLAPPLLDFSDVDDVDAVLDVGCGTGALSFAARDRTGRARIVGLDASRAYVTHAAQAGAGSRVEFEVGDAQDLPFAAAEFDRTLSMLVLNFLPDPERAVREWMRVTKSGGRVAAAVWDYGEGMQMLRAFWDEAVALDPSLAPRDEARMPLCRRGELGALFERAGLTSVEERAITVSMHFSSFDDYWTPFLLGQGPAGACVASLSASRQAELARRLRRRLLQTAAESAFAIQARAWAVKGTVLR